ncbi:thiolase-like protein, partial [Leptodontidium sp. 2 PMI_412]
DYCGKEIECYVGIFGEGWLYFKFYRISKIKTFYIIIGYVDLIIANRRLYEYDIQGPSLVIKTGCLVSLVAFHEAFRVLQSSDCSGAFVAGISLIIGPTTTFIMFSEGILSPKALCKIFDTSINGFARVKAIICVCVYIKLLEDAIRDVNSTRAVIKNTGFNSNSKSQGLMAPNGKAHEALVRKVYLEAGLDLGETGYVECHGIGTATGDPIETNAVGNVFGVHGVCIGLVNQTLNTVKARRGSVV